jgi:hypothetical protein
MKSQKLKRRVTREDVKTLADAIAREIMMWCYYSSGDPVAECLEIHINNPDSWDMYVPKEYEKLYRRVLRSRKKTAALDRAVQARLKKALRRWQR